MSAPKVGRRRRTFKILLLFFGLVWSFFIQYVRARALGRSYDFFEDSKHNRERAIRIRVTALEMGGVLIKVGQFLSSRVDLLPSEYIEELSLLQDQVPPVPLDQIVEVVETEFQRPIREVFPQFVPEPIAAASLGQVHQATLISGEEVAVKIQRPNISEIIEADLDALRYIVHWLVRHTVISRRADLDQVMREFELTLRLELDYKQEAHHAERLAIQMAGSDTMLIPRVYWSHIRPRVLTMQFVRGIKINDVRALEGAGINATDVAEIMLRAYLQQIVVDGFFHADPHPGNIFVRSGPLVVLVDFGMVGEITPAVRTQLRLIFLAVIRRDYDQILLSLDRLGFLAVDADTFALRRAIAWTIDTFSEMSFSDLQTLDMRMVANRLQEVLFDESVQVPPNFAFLGRAVGSLAGLCTALDPSLQFITVAEPYARQLVQEHTGIRGIIHTAAAEARTVATTVYGIPHLTRSALLRFQEGELDFRREFGNVERMLQRLEVALRRLLFALLVAACVVAGAYILTSHERSFAGIAFVLALIFLIGAISPFRSRRR